MNSDSNEVLGGMNNILEPIIAKFESEKDIFLDNADFKAYFQKELLAAGFARDAHQLDEKMRKAQIEAEKIQKNIEDYNAEKFQLLRNFIHEQKEQNAKMQNIIDTLRSNDESLLAANIGQFTANESSNTASLALEQLDNLEQKTINSPSFEQISAKDI